MGALSHACWYLARVIDRPSVHSPLIEKDLGFIDGVLPQSRQGKDVTDQAALQENNYSNPTSPPSVSIEMNHALLTYTSVPEVGIPPVPSRKKFKFKGYTLDDDAQCGYDSDNECGLFLGAVAGEEDYDDGKDITGSMVGECRGGNETTVEAGKLVF